MQQIYTPKQDYKVLVRCFTYNQSKYIEDALNGFAMQKTDFPFVCLVVDDCSTDGEQEVIKAWMERECDMIRAEHVEIELANIILIPHNFNKNCYIALYLLKQNLYKYKTLKMSLVKPWREHVIYEAMCEGDDYWIDPLKLQKQTNFLEHNSEYTLIGSNGIIKYTNINQGLRYFNNHDELKNVSFKELVNTWVFPSASLFYRTDILAYNPEWSKELHFGDDVTVMTCAIHGKIATLGELSCVYRKGVGITKVLDQQQEYMAEQHKLFYSHLLEDTGEKYREILEKRIDSDEKNRKYWHLYNKSKILAALLYPKRTIMKIILVSARTLKYVIKRCLKVI